LVLKVCEGKSGRVLAEDLESGEVGHLNHEVLLRKLIQRDVFPMFYIERANDESER